MLHLAGNPVQRIVADFAAKLDGLFGGTHGLVAGQAPAATKAIDDFTYGRGNCVTDLIAGSRYPSRGTPAGCSAGSFQRVLKSM
ncbi:MAG: hypothetical protein WBL84_22765 [Xanthobacteraceae bacterium]|jgi:hypothetical protein